MISINSIFKNKITACVFLILAVGVLYFDYQNFSSSPEDLYDNLQQVTDFHSISSYQYQPDSTDIKFISKEDPYLIFPFSKKSVFPNRIVLELDNFSDVQAVEIFYKFKGDVGYVQENKVGQLLENDKLRYYFTLPAGQYEELRLDFTSLTSQEGLITISGLGLQPFSYFWFSQSYCYIIAVFIFVLFVLPGFMTFLLLFANDKATWQNLFVFIFPLSMVLYFSVYLVHVITLQLLGNNHFVPFFYLIVLLLFLLYLCVKGNKSQVAIRLLKESKQTCLSGLIILFISLAIVVVNKEKPFETVSYQDAIKHKIFSVFDGGDNQFQYINGTAIVNDEPFSKYYGYGQLVYGVQDRQMLAGTVYAAFRIIVGNLNKYISESYLTYTIFGICLNLMVIFPVIVIFKRYIPEGKCQLLLFVLSINAFVFANYYYTWFKHAGAAFFLSGLICLLDDSSKIKNWLLAGLLFGLSTNMHTGNALGLPLIFLWFCGKEVSKKGLFHRDVILFPVSLIILFALVNLPWAVVKSIFYPDNNALLRQHFLNGLNSEHGLLASAKEFMELYPIKQQLAYRVSHILESFRFHHLDLLLQLIQKDEYRKFFFYWSNYEFFFFIFSLYSLLSLLFVSIITKVISGFLYGKKIFAGVTSLRFTKSFSIQEMYILSALSILTFYGLLFLFYGSDYPDVNHQMPFGTVLLIHIALISLIARTGRVGYGLMSCYMVITGYRLISIPF